MRTLGRRWRGSGALGLDPDLAGAGEKAAAVRAALPDLQRLARAQLLADVIRLDPGQPAVGPRLLVDAVACLDADPGGPAVFAAAEGADPGTARQALAAVAGRLDVSPSLAHHLALVYHRAALFFEEQERGEQAGPCWRLAWRCWLRLLASSAPAVAGDHPLLAHLLGIHRRRVTALLARDQVEPAPVTGPWCRTCPRRPGPSAADRRRRWLSRRRFREELATEYLLATREAMRYGNVPEGWRADYDKGLTGFGALPQSRPGQRPPAHRPDRDVQRLLPRLLRQRGFAPAVGRRGRYTPFALQLAVLADRREADLTARAVLAEFYKFRGFVAPEREHRRSLFREALAFDPRNENVRELLEQTENSKEARR